MAWGDIPEIGQVLHALLLSVGGVHAITRKHAQPFQNNMPEMNQPGEI
jgi:hypothetical protein